MCVEYVEIPDIAISSEFFRKHKEELFFKRRASRTSNFKVFLKFVLISRANLEKTHFSYQ